MLISLENRQKNAQKYVIKSIILESRLDVQNIILALYLVDQVKFDYLSFHDF